MIEPHGRFARLQVAGIYALTRLTELTHHRGLWRAVLLWGKLFPNDNSAVIDPWPGRKLRVYLSDAYWSRLLFASLYPGQGYEMEVEKALRKLLDPNNVFVDCGANIGYWSVFARSLGVRDIIAIEAASRNMKRLRENAALNDNGFEPIQKAVADVAGKECNFLSHPVMHGAGSLYYSKEQMTPTHTVETVTTATIDDLCASARAARKPIVIKLDVEGAEVDALKGGIETLRAGAIVIYEELGKQEEYPATAWLLEQGLSAFLLTVDGKTIPVANVEELRTIKVSDNHALSRNAGYNIAASIPDGILLKKLVSS